MAACFNSSLYIRLVLVMSLLISEYLRKCSSLSVCLFCLQTTCVLCLISGFSYSTNCRSHLRTLKTGPTVCPEKSVRNYQYSLPNNPEEPTSLLLLPANYVLQVNCESCNQ